MISSKSSAAYSTMDWSSAWVFSSVKQEMIFQPVEALPRRVVVMQPETSRPAAAKRSLARMRLSRRA
jgi:hypothetical protein